MAIRVGSRSSRLALWQAETVVARLTAAAGAAGTIEASIVTLSTRGDEDADRPLPEIGGQGLFTERIEGALRSGEIDVAVHSLKDLPVEDAEGLTVGAVIARDEVRDALVARDRLTLDRLPPGAVVGTSSTRRRAQVLALRPDLAIRPLRGNVETRIRKLEAGEYDAVVLAGAGLSRLGLLGRVSEWLAPERFLPAPGQGAIAVQCRASDGATIALLARIDEPELRAAVEAERGFLRALGGGCSAPVGAYARVERIGAVGLAASGQPPIIMLRGRVISPDGRRLIEVEGRGPDPGVLARELASRALGEGAEAILLEAGRLGSGGGRPGLPLAGRRVVVTRARAQSDALLEQLQAAGALAVALPVIRVEPEPLGPAAQAALHDLATFDWILFTSANGVDHLFTRLVEAGAQVLPAAGRPSQALSGQARIAAVGERTAEAVARWGFGVDFVPRQSTGANLARELLARISSSADGGSSTEGPRVRREGRGEARSSVRVLFPRAVEGGEETAALLRAGGAEVIELPVYRTVAEEPTRREIDATSGADAILFASGSAVRSYSALARREPGLALLAQRAAIACIGPSTSASAQRLGLRVAVTAVAHSGEGLVRALIAYFGEKDVH